MGANIKDMLKKLFILRDDTYCVQLPSLFVTQTLKATPKEKKGFFRVKAPITDMVLDIHIAGLETLSVYVLGHDNTTKLMCFDFDKNLQQIDWLRARLEKYENFRKAYSIFRTGGRGLHLFVHFSPAITGATARYLANKFAGDIDCEIFPKQAYKRKYGNPIRLPLGIHKSTGRRSELLYPASLEQIEPIFIPTDMQVATPPMPDLSERLLGINACPNFMCIGKILSQGVDEGSRDEAAFMLARYFYRMGLPPGYAIEVLGAWNNRNNPPLPMDVLVDKIVNTHQSQYGWSCNAVRGGSLLRGFCAGKKCPRFQFEILSP